MTDADSLKFADFLHGGYRVLGMQIEKLGREWAGQWKDSGRFPTPTSSAVPPGEVIIAVEAADFDRLDPGIEHWRLYFVQKLASAVTDNLDASAWDDARAAFEAHTLQYPWGALAGALDHASPNTLDAVERRLGGVLSFWDQLATVRYLDNKRQLLDLDALIRQHCSDFVSLWLPMSTGRVKDDVSAALKTARSASSEAVNAAVAGRLAHLAATSDRVKNRTRLGDQREIGRLLASLDVADRRELETGYGPALRRQLYIWDER